ncbi:hypothetical protein FGO68_gene2167 [Halteria grandinella]|nr:hypothetical protein FGO68_gene2167 [Halteria grandinella]
MAENLENLCSSSNGGETQQIQKAKEIELLALKLDIEQAHEINRGRQLGLLVIGGGNHAGIMMSGKK